MEIHICTHTDVLEPAWKSSTARTQTHQVRQPIKGFPLSAFGCCSCWSFMIVILFFVLLSTELTMRSTNIRWRLSLNSQILRMTSWSSLMRIGWRAKMGRRSGESLSRSKYQSPLSLFNTPALAYTQITQRVLILFRYKEKVKDYNFGSLIRTNAREEYGETNTIFGTFMSI